MSLDYAPAAGKFVLEEFQPNSFTKTFRTDGRPQVFQNDNVTLTFYWTITNGIATEVLLYFAPKATVAGTPRDFQPVSVSLKYSTQGTFGTQPKITITHTGLASKTMSIEGLATSPTEYQWRMNKFDGSIVDGTSSMLLGDELAALRQEFGDPTMEVRVASAETTPAVPGAPPVVARSYFKTNTGDADHPALLKKRVVTTGSGQDSVTQTTKWTHHENPDPAQLFQKNLVSSMTYPDGTWVAYPTYDSVTKKPTVELRPWLDGPATPTAALADPNSCRKTQTEWWIKDLTEVDSDLKGAYVLPEFRHRKVIESAGGTVLSIEQIGTHACLANQLGGPFAGGGELAALSSDLAIIQGRVKWDPNSQTFSSYVKVMSDGAAFGNGDTAAFSGEFDSNTGIFTLRKSLDGKPGYPNEGSYEIQTWNAILNEVHDGDKTFGSVTILSRQPRATRYVASSGGSISEIREVLYSGPEDTVGTVVSTTSFESLSGHTKTTKNGVVVRDEYQTYATLNGKGVVKTLITDADGSESITWEDVGTGEIVQTQSPSGIIKTISHSGMTTTTSISNTTNSFQARESETRDKQGRMVSAIDRNQRVTEWSYSEDGLITTETLPGGATRITSYYKDGQLKSITGTAVVPEYHTYEVNDGTLDQPIGFRPSGSITNVIHTGSATSVRVRWVTRDFQGRVIAEQTVAPPPVSGTVGKITKLYRFSDDQGLEFGSLKSVTIAGSGVEDFTQRVDTTGMGSFIEVQRKAVGTSDYQRRETTRSHVSLNAPGYPSANSYWWSQDTATEYGLGSSGNQSRTSIVRSALNLPGRNSATVTIDPRGSLSLREVVYNNVEGGTKNRVENLKVGLATGNVSLGIVSTFTYQGDLLVSSVEGGVTSQHVYHHSGLLAGLKTSSAGSTVYAISRNFRTVSGPSNTTLQTDEVATETRYGVTTTYSYDSAGRVILAVSPAGSVRYAYDIAGRLTHQWGATYPVAYSYSSIDGQLVSMRTYREGTGFVDTTNATVPAAFDSEPASVTTWVYDEASGALVGKTDHGGRAVTYRYDAQGRLAQRIWARGVTVTYGYDAAGRLSSQVYSDATPAVGWTYNPGGQVLSVTDGSGSHLTSFGTGGSATYPAGESYQPLDADFSLGISRPANIFQNAGTSSTGWKRAQNLTITRNPAGPFNMSTLVNTTHTYAPGGLLETVEADGVRFTYGSYLGNIARTLSVSALNSAGSFTPVPYTTMNKTVATSFGKAFGKVTSIKYGASGTAPESGANLNYFSGWSYTFDSAGRRSTVTSAATGANIRPGWNWGYNARSEVVS
ncbi:MAG: RHS repeat protein, partial [Verrucomicrobiaceae bacterium]|nr:RHS repeat protein [Verrucomicrobiaceae bacterium]